MLAINKHSEDQIEQLSESIDCNAFYWMHMQLRYLSQSVLRQMLSVTCA